MTEKNKNQTAAAAPEAPQADANADTFQCESCHNVRDIEDSFKVDGRYICDDCVAPKEPQKIPSLKARRTAKRLACLQPEAAAPEAPQATRNALAHERDYYKERYNEKHNEAERWLLERNEARAAAAKLAEALKAVLDGPAATVKRGQFKVWDNAFAALAEFEKGAH
jgi:hypothetical protein